MERVARLVKKVTRVKTVSDDFHHTSLRRCLNTFDLTLLGMGHMVGAGIYVLTGVIVRTKAGPSAVLSYIFAGLASLLSALCYAEFGVRVSKAGSAYSYTYITVGEIWAFIVGWNLILEHTLSIASIARSWSGTINSIFDGKIRNGTLAYLGYLAHDNPWISEYPDFLAAGITVVIFLVVVAGAKQSVVLNAIFTLLNMLVIIFFVGFGFSHADFNNWTDSRLGGFFPFGFSGTLSAAASCFYAYIGFESIAVGSEEAQDAARSVPRATVVAMAAVMITYVTVTSALTLMVPYNEVSLTAAFPEAMEGLGVGWARYLVSMGTLMGISCSLLGGAYSLPRCVYAMASDGLLFRVLGKVNPTTQTPIITSIIFGMLSAILAVLLTMETLVEFLSIGTLFVYTVVAANIIILRYSPADRPEGVGETHAVRYTCLDITLVVDKPSRKGRREDLASFDLGGLDSSQSLCVGDGRNGNANLDSERQGILRESEQPLPVGNAGGVDRNHLESEPQDILQESPKPSSERVLAAENYSCIPDSMRARNHSSDKLQLPFVDRSDMIKRHGQDTEDGSGALDPKVPPPPVQDSSMDSGEFIPNHTHDVDQPKQDTMLRDSPMQDSERIPILGKVTERGSPGTLKVSWERVPILGSLAPSLGVAGSMVILVLLLVALNAVQMYGWEMLREGVWWMVVVIVLLIVGIVFFVLVILAHEQNTEFSTFQMPFVPLLPVVSIWFNLMLMMSLSYVTWIRMAIWLAVGFVVYFSYGLHHSNENDNARHSLTPPLPDMPDSASDDSISSLSPTTTTTPSATVTTAMSEG